MQRIDFETSAVVSLRKRVSEVEEINEDLIAFARGHAGAVSSIHEAVLAAIACDTVAELATVITCHWPMLLRVDDVAFAWTAGGEAFQANYRGVREVEPRIVERMAEMMRPVEMRAVGRGHPLFGAACESIRSEALIRLESFSGCGLIALGQTEAPAVEGRHGARLLRFLGQAVSHMLERWPTR
jgi:uncharacterized protein YigA (DUF484 family)